MAIIHQVAREMQEILTTIADEKARETGFVQRASKLSGALFVQTLVFGFLRRPNATWDSLTSTAASLGVIITAPGLLQRCTKAAAVCLYEVLKAAVRRVIAADPVAIPLFRRFRGVFVEDSTVITLPSALAEEWSGIPSTTEPNASALKVMTRLNLLTGHLEHISLHHGRVHDLGCAASPESLPPGALLLHDLGFFALDRLQQVAAQGAFFLCRWKVGTTVYTADGTCWKDLTVFLRQFEDDAVVECPIALGKTHGIPCRLIAVRVDKQIAEQRRRRVRQDAKKKGGAPSAQRLALCDWIILVTNAPEALMSWEEALVLARTRWQIELLFKLWKSCGHVHTSHSEKPWAVLCEVYAKLLGLVIEHWIVLTSVWAYPDRSLVKADGVIRDHVMSLATAIRSVARLKEALTAIQRGVQGGCRMNRRKKHPNTYQLLLELSGAEEDEMDGAEEEREPIVFSERQNDAFSRQKAA